MIRIKLFSCRTDSIGFSNFYPQNNEQNIWKEFKKEQTNNFFIKKQFNEPQADLDLYYFTYQYKLKDIMDPFVNLHYGIFVSQKCLDWMKKYLNLPPVKIYPIHYKKKDKIVSDYFYIYFYFGLRDSIIFDQSFFLISPRFGTLSIEERAVEKGGKFKSFQHFESEEKKFLTETDLGIYYQKILFQKDTISKYDIFPVYLLDRNLYLSEKFVEMYQQECLTGLDSDFRVFDKFYEEE